MIDTENIRIRNKIKLDNDLDLEGNTLTNISDPTRSRDAVNKRYVDKRFWIVIILLFVSVSFHF